MIPILYAATEKEFKSQGLGALVDAITCKVTEERNGSYELSMTYPLSGQHFKDLELSRIIKAVPSYKTDPEPFRIYAISKPLNGIVKVSAEHISYQLSHIPVTPFTASNVVEAMDNLKKYSAEDNPFTFWTSKETQAKMAFTVPTSCRALLGGVEESILDTYKGEYEFTGYTVKLHQNRGSNKGVTLRYGKNLTDLKQEESIANTITGICPFWKSEETEEVVTLPEVSVYSKYANNFPYKRTAVHDFSASFEEKPTVEQLRAKAENYITQSGVGVPNVSLTVSFVVLSQFEEYKNIAALESVNLCDTVNVIFENLGINTTAKVVKTVYDVLLDKYDSITVGSTQNSLTKKLTEIDQAAQDEIGKETSARKRAITELVKKVEQGSGLYVTDKGTGGAHDWFLHDKPVLEESQTIIRINDGGIIFSIDGGETYNGLDWSGTAILQKIYTVGINAAYIDTGQLKVVDNTGKTLFCADMDSGEVTINSGLLKVGAGYINTDGRFKIGSMYSQGGVYNKDTGIYERQDVCFDKAIFINYGIELYGNNDSAEGIAYCDFHSGSDVTTGDSLYDYTGRLQNYLAPTGTSEFTFSGKKKVDDTKAGTCTVAVNGTIVHSSDRRLKTNIEDISCDTATDWIMALNPVKYNYKADSELKVHHGLVYQEVQETAKELSMDNLALLQEFRGADKVVYGAIGYEELIADLIKVVQNHEKILRGEQND